MRLRVLTIALLTFGIDLAMPRPGECNSYDFLRKIPTDQRCRSYQSASIRYLDRAYKLLGIGKSASSRHEQCSALCKHALATHKGAGNLRLWRDCVEITDENNFKVINILDDLAGQYGINADEAFYEAGSRCGCSLAR